MNINLILGVFVLLVPIFYLNRISFSLAQNTFFVLGSLALFFLSFSFKPKRKFTPNIWISLFFLWCLFTVLANSFTLDPKIQWFFLFTFADNLMPLLAGFLFYYVIYTHCSDIKIVLKFILALALINFLVSVTQYFNYDITGFTATVCTEYPCEQFRRIFGMMGTYVHLSNFSVVIAPLLAMIHPALVLIPITTALLTTSLTPCVALGCGMIYFFRKQKIILALILLLGIGMGIAKYPFIKGRFYMKPITWKWTMQTILKKPIIGYGFNSYKEVMPRMIKEKVSEYPMNEPLGIGLEAGIPILIIIAGYFINLLKRIRPYLEDKQVNYLTCALIIFIMLMMGRYPLRFIRTAYLLPLVLSLLEARIYDLKWGSHGSS